QVLTDPVHLLAFGLGSGLAPVAPGTAGTLAAVPLVIASAYLPFAARVALGGVLLIVAVWACGASARKLDVHDYGGIVLDEIASFYLMMLALPVNALWLALGFVAFRVFDVA